MLAAMKQTEIQQLVDYNFWADGEIFDACARVAIDDFVKPAVPDPGWHSLRGTLVHLVDVEYGWRALLQNLPDDGVLAEADYADVAALRARWERERAAWTAYAASLTDDEINGVWRVDEGRQRTRWQTILHVLTEGMYHRSEAAAMLTGYGQSPGELDFEGWLVWTGR
jgi:uncharacterized damage-inducible protein DinB